MDPFSITVGALGVTEFAISSISELYNVIRGLAEANEVVQDIASNLDAIQRPLNALGELKISDSVIYTTAREDLEKAGVAEAVNHCGEACADFTKRLKQWTKNSSSTKLSLRDRLSVGVWRKEKIRTLRTQVQSCQGIVHFAVDSAQLIVQFRSEYTAQAAREELKKQLHTLQEDIQKHIDLTKAQQSEAQKRKEELQEEPEHEEDDGAQRALALQEIEEQSRILQADRIASGVVFLRIHGEITRQDIGNVMTSDDSRAIVGMPESVVGKVNQRIGDVTTQRKSAARVGVFEGSVDMRDFFKR